MEVIWATERGWEISNRRRFSKHRCHTIQQREQLDLSFPFCLGRYDQPVLHVTLIQRELNQLTSYFYSIHKWFPREFPSYSGPQCRLFRFLLHWALYGQSETRRSRT
jgi:hypothetical protein